MSPGSEPILATVLFLLGVAILLVAVFLAVTTTVGWPKLTLTGAAIVVIAMLLIARGMRTPS
jgi:hypothetical protein